MVNFIIILELLAGAKEALGCHFASETDIGVILAAYKTRVITAEADVHNACVGFAIYDMEKIFFW